VASISVDVVGAASYLARVARLPAGIQAAALKAMGVVGRELEKHVKVNHLSGQDLDVRTGNLRRAIFHEVGRLQGGDAYARIGADIKKAPYARVHELGGTIRPKKSRYLTIPLTAAQTKKGVARFSARDVIQNPAGFGYTGTFVHNHVIFGKKLSGGIEPLFALKDSVTIKAVGYLSRSANEKRAWVVSTVNHYVSEAFNKVLGRG
jgi:hypothetical protein